MNPPVPENPQPLEQVEIQMPDDRKAAAAFISVVLTLIVLIILL